jgi:hypothetical protein
VPEQVIPTSRLTFCPAVQEPLILARRILPDSLALLAAL